MHTRRILKFLTPVAACFAFLVSFALPAAATTSTFDVNDVRSRIAVVSPIVTENFDTPSAGTPVCQGATSIQGDIDDSNHTISGTLDIESDGFTIPGTTSPYYKLIASGSSNTGTYTGGAFSGLTFGSISFSIEQINSTTCVPTGTVCSGTATLTTSGAVIPPASPPLNPGDQVYVNGSGSITSVSSCAFPWSAFITTSTTLSLGQNPAYPSDPGAIFQQV